MALLTSSVRRRRNPNGVDPISRLFGVITTALLGVVIGIQYWTPNKRVIPVVVSVIIMGLAWRLSMASAINLLVFLLPYPKGTVFGNTNLAFILIIFVLWLLRLSLRTTAPARGTPSDLPLFALVLWYILSFYNVETQFAFVRAIENFELFIACVLMFYLIINSVRTQADLRRLHHAQLITALGVFLTAAWEARHAGQVLIPGILDFTDTIGSNFNTRDVRVGASFRDFELLSEYCGLIFLYVLFYLARAKSRTQLVMFGLFGLFNVYTMFTTVTRGVFVALGITLPYLFFIIRRHLNPVRFIGGVTAILVLAAVMNFAVSKYTNTGDVFERLITTKVVHGIIPESREMTWSNALSRALVHPILGQGPFYAEMPGYSSLWPHNVYLFFANIVGFPGLLFFLAFLATLLRGTRPTVDDLRHASYADAYLIIARVQLLMFMLNEMKIDFVRNPIYQFQAWVMFATWMAAHLVSRETGVRAGYFLEPPSTAPEQRGAG